MELWIFGLGMLAMGLGAGFPLGIRFNWRQIKEQQEHDLRISAQKTERMQMYQRREHEHSTQEDTRARRNARLMVNSNHEAERASRS